MGNVLIIKVDADLQGDSIRLRVNDVIQATEDDLVDTDKPDMVNEDLIRPETEDFNREEKIVIQKYTIKISDITAIDLIAEKLELGKGSDIINLKFYDNNLKKDIKLEIGNTYSLILSRDDYFFLRPISLRSSGSGGSPACSHNSSISMIAVFRSPPNLNFNHAMAEESAATTASKLGFSCSLNFSTSLGDKYHI